VATGSTHRCHRRAGCSVRLKQIALDFYDRIVGLVIDQIAVDGSITKAPGGSEVAGRSPVDRGKQGLKRSGMTDGYGIALGRVLAGANPHDSPLLSPTLDRLDDLGPPSTWTPTTTPTRPAPCSTNEACTAGSTSAAVCGCIGRTTCSQPRWSAIRLAAAVSSRDDPGKPAVKILNGAEEVRAMAAAIAPESTPPETNAPIGTSES